MHLAVMQRLLLCLKTTSCSLTSQEDVDSWVHHLHYHGAGGPHNITHAALQQYQRPRSSSRDELEKHTIKATGNSCNNCCGGCYLDAAAQNSKGL
jgi:hypothetical protein